MDAARRKQILGEACPEDAQGRAEVKDHLSLIDSIAVEAVATPTGLKDASGLHHLPTESEPIGPDCGDAPVGRRIGAYLVTARLGDGGMNAVVLATRIEDSTQQVAIKLVEPGPNSDVILKRFQAEIPVQTALGMHPNITAFLDAGTTEDGHLYFVMEHIDGLPIDEYCDKKRLTVSARLRLFAQVCQAIQFAHKHAIIHRNLKPSNILVTLDGIPKLIDFGFAALVQPETGGETASNGTRATLTGTAELVLSPKYASPEQVRGEIVTTASDVYALGLVLYKLLSGRWPYRLGAENTAEIFQAICEQVPEKPSTAVGRSLADPSALQAPPPASEPRSEPVALSVSPWPTTADEIAAVRGLTAPQLKRTLAGDLDTIVLMAIRKEPEWRYTSAEQLSEDLHRYLKGLPLLAHRDTLAYRTTKFVKRHVTAVLIGFILFLALVSGVIGITTRLVITRRERDRAERSAYQARLTVDQLFTRVTKERILKQPGLYPLRKTLLQDTHRFYESFLKERGTDPTLRAETALAHARVAEISHLTGSGTSAIAQYQRAVALWENLVAEQPGNQDYQASLVQTLSNFGTALLTLEGRLNEALDAFRQAEKLLGPLITTHPGSIPLHTELGAILLNIAEIQRRQGKPDDAIVSLERVLAIDSQLVPGGPEAIELRISQATAHATLGQIYGTQPDQWLEAVAAHGRAIELRELLTREHPELADQAYELASELSDLSNLQQKMGQPDPAFDNNHRALEIFERIAQMYPNVALYQVGLGMTYNLMSDLERQRGEKADALVFAQRGRTLFEHLVASNPKEASYRRNLTKSCNNVGRLLAQAGEPSEALRALQRSVDLVESLPHLDSQDSYNLACGAALCIPLIGLKNRSQSAPHELSKGDRIRRTRYGDRAIEALRRSAADGFLSAEIVQNDTDLDALRTRADFQALVKEVEEKPPMAPQ